MFILLGLTLLLLVALIYMATQYNRHRMPSRKRRAQVLREIKEDMDGWSADLVKMNKEELDLFSLTQDKQVIKRGTGTTAKGTFRPLPLYSSRQPLSS